MNGNTNDIPTQLKKDIPGQLITAVLIHCSVETASSSRIMLAACWHSHLPRLIGHLIEGGLYSRILNST